MRARISEDARCNQLASSAESKCRTGIRMSLEVHYIMIGMVICTQSLDAMVDTTNEDSFFGSMYMLHQLP